MAAKQLKAETYARFADEVNTLVLGVLVNRPDLKPTRRGAYFCVSTYGVTTVGGLVGQIDSIDECRMIDVLSRGKCVHMYEHRSLGHRLTRQSSTGNLTTTGAVAGNSCEYCFVGYPSYDADEIASVMLACKCEDLSRDEGRKLLGMNPLFGLFEEYFDEPDFGRSGGTGC